MSIEALAAWKGLLADIGTLGDALVAAIDGDRIVDAISAMVQLRQTRAALARVEAPLAIAGELAEVTAMADIAPLLVKARGVDAVMQHWLARPLPADAQLLASPLGIAAMADALLPSVWDFETDLVVLVGAELAPVAGLLKDIGQRRMIIVDGDAPGAIAVKELAELAPAVRSFTPHPPNSFCVRALVDAPEVKEIVKQVEDAVFDLRVHRNTMNAFSKTWLEHGLANLPALAAHPSIADVGDAFAGMPMVIVAPGPSLANNVAQLRALKGRAIITAFSHSLKPVLAAGVVPDLVVTVDPQDVRYHFAGCDVSQTCIVNAATVHPSLFELPAARFLTLAANSAVDAWLFDAIGHEAGVPGGGSVATTAFSLALRWKCDPIVFIGLDLSFPGGAYYVSTSSDGGARAEIGEDGRMSVSGWSADFHAMKSRGGPAAVSERQVTLPGWAGGTVPSSFMFALFHRWFEERMRSVASTVYNATEGGAHIAGMTHVPLSRIAFPAGIVDVGQVIDLARECIRGERPARVTDHVAAFVSELRRARRLSSAALREISRHRTGASLSRLGAALATSLKPLAFASLLAQRELDKASDVARRTGSESDYLLASTRLMTTLDAVLAQLEPQLQTALTSLRQV